MAPRKEYPNDLYLSMPSSKDAELADSSMVILKGKPFIKVSVEGEKDVIYTFEQLVNIQSQIVQNGLGYFHDVGLEVLAYRAQVGQKAILSIWTKQGYTASDFAGKAIAIEEAPALAKLIPVKNVLKDKSKKNGAWTPVLKFINEGHRCFWALVINEGDNIVSKAAWDDIPSIKKMAEAVLDDEYVGSAFGLKDPNRSSELVLIHQKKQEEKVTLSYFKEAIFSAKQKRGLEEARAEYFGGVDAILKSIYEILNAGSKELLPRSVPLANLFKDTRVVLFPNNPNKAVAFNDSFAVSNHHKVYSGLPKEVKAEIRKREKVFWENYKKRVHDLGLTLIQDRSRFEPKEWDSDAKLAVIFHSFLLVKDEAKYFEWAANNKSNKNLFLHAESGIEASKASK